MPENLLRRIPRRELLIGGASGAGGFLLRGLLGHSKEDSQDQNLFIDGVIDNIQNRFGIEIPKEPSSQYRVDKDLGNYFGVLNDGLNTRITLDEAQVLEETIARIPAAGRLAQLIIPYRFQGENNIAGGSYIGNRWPCDHGEPITCIMPENLFISDKAAFELKLPSVNLSDPLPMKQGGDIPLPLFGFVTHAGKSLNLEEELPWTTHRERLKQTIVHEFGHGLEDQIAFWSSNGMTDYYSRQAFTIYNFSTTDSAHPLYRTFAQINGWRLVPFSQFVDQYDPRVSEEYEEKEKQGDIMMLWDRDPNVWGDINNRKIRLTTYASYGPIQEVFCEFWMASILYPEFLNSRELTYFRKIHEGLKGNYDEFVGGVVKNSQILL